MKRNDPTFKEMVARLQSGELTRNQAAEAYGLKPNTLITWLLRSKIDIPRDSSAGLRGAALTWTKDDPVRKAALAEAVAKVLSGELTGDQAFAIYADKGVARATLFLEVRKILAAQGIKRRPGRPPKVPRQPLPVTPPPLTPPHP